MKYLSIDIETSSLQPSPDHILMVSMVVEDSAHPEVPVEDLPHFTCYVSHGEYKGEAYALGMNGWILDILSGRNKETAKYPIFKAKQGSNDQLWHGRSGMYEVGSWVGQAQLFLDERFDTKKITVAGKNAGTFDLQFFPAELKSRFDHRVIDPGPMFLDWSSDSIVPGFQKCLDRAGLSEVKVSHDARQDAMDVITLLRRTYEA